MANVKLDEIEFVQTVGASWSVKSINLDTRGMKFTCERSADGQDFFLSKVENGTTVRTITVPRHLVAWWHDAEVEPVKKAAKSAA